MSNDNEFLEGTIDEAKSMFQKVKSDPLTKRALVWGGAVVGVIVARNLLKTKTLVVEINEDTTEESVETPDGTTTTTTTSHKKASTKEH